MLQIITKLKNCFPLLFLLLCTSTLINCELVESPEINSDGTITILHSNYNFSLDYPQYLNAQLTDEKGYKGQRYVRFIAYSSPLLEWINVTIEINEKTNPSLQDVIDWHKNSISSREESAYEYKLLSFQESSINNYKIIRHKYTFEHSELINDAVYIARKNDMVVIQMRVESEQYDQFQDDFEKLVLSFDPFE